MKIEIQVKGQVNGSLNASMAGSKDVANVEAVLLKMLRLRPKVHEIAEQSPEEEKLLNQIEGQLATMSEFFLNAYSNEMSSTALKEVVKLTGASSDDRGDFTKIKQAASEKEELEADDRVCFEQEVEIVTTSQSSSKGKRKRRHKKEEGKLVKTTRMKVPISKPRL